MSISEEAQGLFDYTRTIRRDLHAHPELGYEEVRTAGVISSELSKLEIEHRTGVAKTGIIAMIEGDQPGPVLLIRFDMDALPVHEETGVEYVSQNPGKMHACGHDGHVAIGLTVAKLLNLHRSDIHGSVKLMFQPAEEGADGAERMITEGVLDGPKPDLALALHIWNEKPLGWIGVVPGPFMAASDIFRVKITGKGGHAAIPNLVADPIVTASQVINNLQTIVSRNVSPLQTAVVSVTKITGGEAFNVIPGSVEFWGTIRTFENDVRKKVIDRFNTIVSHSADLMGCQASIHLESLTPPVVNDLEIAASLKSLFTRLLPKDEIDADYQTMGSEDMAFVLEKIPGCYFMVGSANAEEDLVYSHHHPKFNFDENVLPKAAALMTEAALNLLNP